MDPGRNSEPFRRSFDSFIVLPYLCAAQVIATSMGQLLTDMLGTAAQDGNPPSLAPLLSFMQKDIHLHGSKVELGPRNDAANGPIQVVAKDLMLMSYEAVRSSGASRDHNVSPEECRRG